MILKIKNLILLLMPLVVLTGAFITLQPTNKTWASHCPGGGSDPDGDASIPCPAGPAPKGCYTKSGNNYIKVTCAKDDHQDAVENGACYVYKIVDGEVDTSVDPVDCSIIPADRIRDPSEPYFTKNDCNNDTDGDNSSTDKEDCNITNYIVIFTNILASVVGLVVAASIIIAGIQYSSAGGDPQKISAAKNRIRDAVIALLVFIFMYAILSYLIPGGLL